MNKYANIDRVIDDALQMFQMRAPGIPGSPSIAGAMGLIGARNPFLEGYAKAWAPQAIMQDFGPLKATGLRQILPAAGAIIGGGLLVKHLYDRWALGQSERALLMDPDLAGKHPPQKIQETMDLISLYAPSLAKDPKTAKHLARRALQFEGITSKDVEELLNIEKKYQETRGIIGSIVSPAFGAVTALL